jgi:probable phosphoglycerate mutase
MKILVTRHGQTDWNLENRIQGWSDNPINENGVSQARILRDKLKDTKIDICYCSSLLRAAETAQIVLGYKDDGEKKCPIRYDKRLRERGFGSLEGKVTSTVESFIFRDSWSLDLNAGKYGIEPIREIYRRVYDFYHSSILPLKEEFGDDATVLIVTHGGASRVLNYVILGGDIVPEKSSEAYVKAQSFVLKNCDLVEYTV